MKGHYILVKTIEIDKILFSNIYCAKLGFSTSFYPNFLRIGFLKKQMIMIIGIILIIVGLLGVCGQEAKLTNEDCKTIAKLLEEEQLIF